MSTSGTSVVFTRDPAGVLRTKRSASSLSAAPIDLTTEEDPAPKVRKAVEAKSRNVCFTIFEHPEAWIEYWQICDLPPSVKYIVAQLESAPDTALRHVQGYVEFSAARTFKSIKQLLGRNSAHLEARKGSAQQASDYCKKEESRVSADMMLERGEISAQGKRTDIQMAAQIITEHKEQGMRMLAEQSPEMIVKYHRGFEKLCALLHRPAQRPKPKIYYLHGPPGCGKSSWAHKTFPNAYNATDNVQGWFDGYCGEPEVIFDDFMGRFPIESLLRLCDFWPVQQAVKGSHAPIRATTFVFTSNYAPEEHYLGTKSFDAWIRRIRDFGVVMDQDRISLELAATQADEEGERDE